MVERRSNLMETERARNETKNDQFQVEGILSIILNNLDHRVCVMKIVLHGKKEQRDSVQKVNLE